MLDSDLQQRKSYAPNVQAIGVLSSSWFKHCMGRHCNNHWAVSLFLQRRDRMFTFIFFNSHLNKLGWLVFFTLEVKLVNYEVTDSVNTMETKVPRNCFTILLFNTLINIELTDKKAIWSYQKTDTRMWDNMIMTFSIKKNNFIYIYIYYR